ncbi:MAG TPA: alpha/beta hydrolase [Candidatus Angelobacter sp.]
MPSIRGRLANTLVKLVVKRWPRDNPTRLVRRARRIFGEPKLPGFRQSTGVKIEQVSEDVRGEWLTPEPLRFPEAVLLYIHGGGYVSCSPRSHRPITAALARRIGCRVFSLDYRLAPENPFPAAAEDAVKAAEWLMASSVKPGNLALAGDSAGGGLVITTLVRLRDLRLPLPACGVCMSPWVDLTGEFTCTNTTSCAMFFPEDGLAFAKVYLNGASARSTLASPLLADLRGLPPLLIQVANSEMLYDDSIRLNEKAAASGVQTSLRVYDRVPHVWQMFGGVVPEADQALHEIAEFVREKLTRA